MSQDTVARQVEQFSERELFHIMLAFDLLSTVVLAVDVVGGTLSYADGIAAVLTLRRKVSAIRDAVVEAGRPASVTV